MNKKSYKRYYICLPGGICINPPISLEHLTKETVISGLISLTLIFATLYALYLFITAGIQWTASGGDKTKIEKAKGRLTYAVIGLILTLCSFLIVNVLYYFFKV